MTVTVPDSFKDLLEKPIVVTVTTVSSAGKPYSSAIWRRFNGEHILMVTGQDTRKYKNLVSNPHVSVLTIDPKNPYRYMEVRGIVESIDTDAARAIAELDRLTMFYLGKARYFGDVEPEANDPKYQGVTLKIKPTRIGTFGS